ncbi:MAG: 5-(carboxyamino)imidazole ribonucleotide mutase [Chrysiogenetes bacterium]|nr:5-(carboxyamino)imidazole ribonucleotide mutase [Chrysiogenetes bacterium]
MADVLILMGSDSDAEVMKVARDELRKMGISVHMTVASAHRTPDRVHTLVSEAEANGTKVFISGAGAAAHLGGVIASITTRPVIGVPIASSEMGSGLDALLSTVQMPPGIPVACSAIGKAGAKNAAILAAQIIGVGDPEVANAVKESRANMRKQVLEKAKKVEEME